MALVACTPPGRFKVGEADSSGVRIIVNAYSERTSTPIHLERCVGTSEATPKTFDRVVDLKLTPAGTIALAEGNTGKVALLDASGRQIGGFGRWGTGPGEFRSISSLSLRGRDELLVFDGLLRRVVVFGPGGHRSTSQILPPRSDLGSPVDVVGFDDQLLLISFAPKRPPKPSSASHFGMKYLFMCTLSMQCSPVMQTRDRELFVQRIDGTGNVAFWDLAFGRRNNVRVGQGLVWMSDGTEFAVDAYRPDGTLVRRVRLIRARRQVSPVDIDRYKAREAAETRGLAPRTVQAALAAMPFPSQLPAIRIFELASNSAVWVEEYPRAGMAPTWFRFSVEGRLSGAFQFPLGFTPRHFLESGVLGTHEESDGGVAICFALTPPLT